MEATKTKPAYVRRMEQEIKELRDRRSKLGAFINSPAYDKLSAEDQFLLCQQSAWMEGYYGVLWRRIVLAGGDPNWGK
jgi:hypothetical protein